MRIFFPRIVEYVLQFPPHRGEVFLISSFRCFLSVVCFCMSAYEIQTTRNYPEESIQHSEHGESLKSRIFYNTCLEETGIEHRQNWRWNVEDKIVQYFAKYGDRWIKLMVGVFGRACVCVCVCELCVVRNFAPPPQKKKKMNRIGCTCPQYLDMYHA